MTPWQEYKKKRQEQLDLGATVRPGDLLDRNNYISEEESQARYTICEQCPSLIKFTHQCKECGCFMKLKVKLKKAECPLGKW